MIQSFDPISRSDTRILILGSMPGKVSLQASEYYAHPRNLFWDIIEEVLGIPRQTAYDQRLLQLQQQQIALWDVAFQCQRESSLDSDIVSSTVEANDFKRFFARHPQLRRICLNGNKAAELFARHVQKNLESVNTLEVLRLPSTSPANASIKREIKLELWRQALTLD